MPRDPYISLLKACHKRKTLTLAHLVHTHLVQHNIELCGLLGDYLAVTLAKCGAVEDALYVSQMLPSRTVFSWTAIITACTESEQHRDAIEFYHWMLDDGVEPDHFTFVSLFKACSNLLDLEEGRRLHAHARLKGYALYAFVGNTLVSMYGKCGSIADAEHVFGDLTQHDVVSWNALLSGYNEQGEGEKALMLYRQMIENSLKPNRTTFVISFQACGALASKEDCLALDIPCYKAMYLEIGQALYADARKHQLASDLHVYNALVSMYSKCATLVETECVFLVLSERDIISWNAMLSAYVEHGKDERALQLYTQMHVIADQVTMVIALQACGNVADKEEAVVFEGHLTKVKSLGIGHLLHTDAMIKGFALDLMLGTTLVSFYGSSGAISDAEIVFSRLPVRSVASWNAMLSTYVEQGEGEKALQVYRQMLDEDVCLDKLSFTIALRACGSLEGASLEIGQALHAEARRKGCTFDAFLNAALVYMYSRCCFMEEALRVFSWLSPCDSMSWTVMLSAYMEQGQAEKVLQLYRLALGRRVQLTETILISVLEACTEVASIEVCQHLHFTIVCMCYDLSDLRLSLEASLIHAYGTCASMVEALAVFEGLPKPDVVSWNACIGGFAVQGSCRTSLEWIEALILADITPTGATFASALSACTHVGLVGEGLEYMTSMSDCYNLAPKLKHFSCMIDLLGRAGSFSRLVSFLMRMPVQPDSNLWLCLLGACRIHGNVDLGKVAFDNAVDLDPKDTAAYILMSNIYTSQECVLLRG